MKKLMIMSAMIFALGFIPAVSYGVGMGNPGERNSIAREYKSAKAGELASEYQARRIIRTYVQNNRGHYLGQITDLLIDPQDGGIAFAVISRGGVLGIPMRFVAVPFSGLTFSKEKDLYLLDISREKMAAAPSFDRYQWPNAANLAWDTEIYTYYGQTPIWGESNEPVAQSRGQASDFNKIRGESIKNQEGEKLGNIYDLVINSRGQVLFAVLSHGGFLGLDEKFVVVPFSALSFDQKEKELVLNVTKEKLNSGPEFKKSDLSSRQWAEDVYRHFGQQPYWAE